MPEATPPAADGLPIVRQEEIARLRSHPAFGEATRRSALSGMMRRSDDPLIFEALRDSPRYLSAIWALYLDLTPGGLTRARFGVPMGAVRPAGEARSLALIYYLRAIGHIEPLPLAARAGERVYAPTARLKAAFRRWMRRELVIFGLLEPDALRAAALFDEDGFYDAYLRAFGEAVLRSADLKRPVSPSLDVLALRRGGLLMLSNLALSGAAGDTMPPSGPLKVPVGVLARRCAVSRPHIRRMLREAEAAGLFERVGRSLRMTPVLHDRMAWLLSARTLMAAWASRKALADYADGAIP